MDLPDITGRIVLTDEYSAPLANVAKSSASIGSAFDDMGKKLSSVGDNLSKIGGQLALGISAPLAAAATAALTMSGTFEASMTRLTSIAGVSSNELEMVKEHILDLAPAAGIGPQALAEAMTKVSSTVSDTNVALSILDIAAQGTKAGFGDTVAVAGALTAVINSYGASNITAAQAGDILAQTIKEGGAEAKELAPTLANVTPLAAQMGLSFAEVGANIATFTKLGVPAAEAVTSLSSVMTALLKPTSQGEQALASVGLSFEALRQSVREHGLLTTMNDLLEKFHGNDEALADVFGRVEALRNVLGTAAAQGDTYAAVLGSITEAANSGGAALTSMADAMSGKTTQTWAELSAQVQVIAIRIGDGLAPAFGAAVKAITPLVDAIEQAAEWFSKLPAPIQVALGAVGAFGAALPVAVFGIGQLISSAGTISTAIGGLVKTFGSATVATEAFATAQFSTQAAGLLTAAASKDMIAGMTAAGEAATASSRMIAGMSVAAAESSAASTAAASGWAASFASIEAGAATTLSALVSWPVLIVGGLSAAVLAVGYFSGAFDDLIEVLKEGSTQFGAVKTYISDLATIMKSDLSTAWQGFMSAIDPVVAKIDAMAASLLGLKNQAVESRPPAQELAASILMLVPGFNTALPLLEHMAQAAGEHAAAAHDEAEAIRNAGTIQGVTMAELTAAAEAEAEAVKTAGMVSGFTSDAFLQLSGDASALAAAQRDADEASRRQAVALDAAAEAAQIAASAQSLAGSAVQAYSDRLAALGINAEAFQIRLGQQYEALIKNAGAFGLTADEMQRMIEKGQILGGLQPPTSTWLTGLAATIPTIKDADKAWAEMSETLRVAGIGHETLTGALAANKAALAALTTEQRNEISAGIEQGLSTEKISAATHIAAGVIDMFKDSQKESEAATKKSTEALTKHREELDKFSGKAALDDVIKQMKMLAETTAETGKTLADMPVKSIKDFADAISLAANSGQTLTPEMIALGTQAEFLSLKTLDLSAALAKLPQDMSVLHLKTRETNELMAKTREEIGGVVTGLPAFAGGFTQSAAEIEKAARAMIDFVPSVASVGVAMADAAQRAIEGGGNITQAMVGAFGQQMQAMIKEHHSLLGLSAGQMQLVGAAATGVSVGMANFNAVNEGASKSSAVLSGAMTGVSTALSGMADGFKKGDIVAGVLAGGIAILTGLFGDAEKKVNDDRDAMFSAAGGFEALADKTVAATGELTLLQAVLDADNPKKYEAAINDLNAAIKDHENDLKDWASTLEDVVSSQDLMSEAVMRTTTELARQDSEGTRGTLFSFLTTEINDVTDSFNQATEDWSAPLLDLADAADESASHLADLGDSGKASGEDIADAMADAVHDAVNLSDAVVDNSDDFSRFGSIAVGVFEQAQEAGMNATEALAAMHPALATLSDVAERLGYETGGAFDEMLALAETAEAFSPAIDQVSSLGNMMVGLNNTGLLTSSLFYDLSGQVADTFDDMVAGGASAQTALRLMQPDLQTIWELQDRFGFEVDASTQSMLDQAVAAGIVGEQFKSAQERMVDAVNKLVFRLEDVLTQMGILPAAAGTAADGMANQFSRGAQRMADSVEQQVSRARAALNDLADTGIESGQAVAEGGAIAAEGESPTGLKEIELKVYNSAAPALEFLASLGYNTGQAIADGGALAADGVAEISVAAGPAAADLEFLRGLGYHVGQAITEVADSAPVMAEAIAQSADDSVAAISNIDTAATATLTAFSGLSLRVMQETQAAVESVGVTFSQALYERDRENVARYYQLTTDSVDALTQLGIDALNEVTGSTTHNVDEMGGAFWAAMSYVKTLGANANEEMAALLGNAKDYAKAVESVRKQVTSDWLIGSAGEGALSEVARQGRRDAAKDWVRQQADDVKMLVDQIKVPVQEALRDAFDPNGPDVLMKFENIFDYIGRVQVDRFLNGLDSSYTATVQSIVATQATMFVRTQESVDAWSDHVAASIDNVIASQDELFNSSSTVADFIDSAFDGVSTSTNLMTRSQADFVASAKESIDTLIGIGGAAEDIEGKLQDFNAAMRDRVLGGAQAVLSGFNTAASGFTDILDELKDNQKALDDVNKDWAKTVKATDSDTQKLAKTITDLTDKQTKYTTQLAQTPQTAKAYTDLQQKLVENDDALIAAQQQLAEFPNATAHLEHLAELSATQAELNSTLGQTTATYDKYVAIQKMATDASKALQSAQIELGVAQTTHNQPAIDKQTAAVETLAERYSALMDQLAPLRNAYEEHTTYLAQLAEVNKQIAATQKEIEKVTDPAIAQKLTQTIITLGAKQHDLQEQLAGTSQVSSAYLDIQKKLVEVTNDLVTAHRALAGEDVDFDAAMLAHNAEVDAMMNTWRDWSSFVGPSFDIFGVMATAAFSQAQAAGASFLDAILAIQPALATLQEAQAAFGVTASPILQHLMDLAGQADANKPVLKFVAGLNQMMDGLGNTANLTQEQFSAVTQGANLAFEELVKGGMSTEDAMRVLAPTLQDIWTLWTSWGYSIDGSAAGLLDNAKNMNLVGDAFKSAEERIADSVGHMVSSIDTLVDRMTAISQLMSTWSSMGIALTPGNLMAAGAGDLTAWAKATSQQYPGTMWDVLAQLVLANPLPQIPSLGEGGIVTGPTLALIGESGPEKVEPLSKGNNQQADAQALALALAQAFKAAGIKVEVDGRQFGTLAAQYVADYLEKSL